MDWAKANVRQGKKYLKFIIWCTYIKDLTVLFFSAFASREMTLPDIGMVHGRMIVTAWDLGLDNVEDNAVRIMMNAIEVRWVAEICLILNVLN